MYKSLKLIPDIGIGIPFLHLKDLARMPYIFPYTPFIYNNSEESGRSTPNDLINSIFLAVFGCHFHLFDKDLLLFITIWREKLLVYCKCRILWLFLEMKMQRWEKSEQFETLHRTVVFLFRGYHRFHQCSLTAGAK